MRTCLSKDVLFLRKARHWHIRESCYIYLIIYVSLQTTELLVFTVLVFRHIMKHMGSANLYVTENSAQLTSQRHHKHRSLVALAAYVISTGLYLIGLRVALRNQLAVAPFCFLAWLLPDLMAIKMQGRPHPAVERILLNLVGPWSSACCLQSLLFNDALSCGR